MIMPKTPRGPAAQHTAPNTADHVALEHGRLATIGAITVGLGHDLRNAIAPAMLRLDALARASNLGEGTHRELRAIRSSIGEMQHIAAGLHLLVADPEEVAAVPCTTHLANWWRDLAPLVHSATSPGTLVRADIPERTPTVEMPPHVLAQVVMALAMNARALMQGDPSPHLQITARTTSNRVVLTLEHAGQSTHTAMVHTADDRLMESAVASISGLSAEQMQTLLRAHNAELTRAEDSSHGVRFDISLTVCTEDGTAAQPTVDITVTGPFSVMCIDDNALLIDALESRLTLEAGFTQLHRAEPLTDCVAIVARLKPTVVLLDYDLPDGIDALRVLERLVKESPASPVIVFTGFPNHQLVRDAMALGAQGFVAKGVQSDRLIAAIHRVRNGDAVLELDD